MGLIPAFLLSTVAPPKSCTFCFRHVCNLFVVHACIDIYRAKRKHIDKERSKIIKKHPLANPQHPRNRLFDPNIESQLEKNMRKIKLRWGSRPQHPGASQTITPGCYLTPLISGGLAQEKTLFFICLYIYNFVMFF